MVPVVVELSVDQIGFLANLMKNERKLAELISDNFSAEDFIQATDNLRMMTSIIVQFNAGMAATVDVLEEQAGE